jgi:hypothetical protein
MPGMRKYSSDMETMPEDAVVVDWFLKMKEE